MATERYDVVISHSKEGVRESTLEGEVYRKTAGFDSSALTALEGNLDASVNAVLSADGVSIINQVRDIDIDEAATQWDATNKETIGDLMEALTAADFSADVKAGLSDLSTMLQSADASFTSTLQTAFKNLMALTEADGLADDDISIIRGILTALAAADASYGASHKDAMARLLVLILADTDISTVISAIAALE
jgi:hypothetical protein